VAVPDPALLLGRRDDAVRGDPGGDFFASGWGGYAQISSLAVCVNPGSAFNSYWRMPFRKSFRITAENLGEDEMTL